MPDVALAACLVLVVTLVVTAVVAFWWSHRKDDPMGSLVGLGALVVAGGPAAAYGAMAAL
jgi:hypothetical protein